MTSWPALEAELDRWLALGRAATLWWRDDDATTATAALDELLELARDAGVPLALAVIPAGADTTLGMAVRGGGIDVLQHGFMHRSHAPAGCAKAELGPHRPVREMLAELCDGRKRLENICSGLPVLVPPWNRIAPVLSAALPQIGVTGLSAFGARRGAPPGLAVANVHIDIMSWTTRRFAGEDAVLAAAVRHLAERRQGVVDAAEPTGLLTHHLAHDPPAWRFLRRFLRKTAAHPAVRWCRARDIFEGKA